MAHPPLRSLAPPLAVSGDHVVDIEGTASRQPSEDEEKVDLELDGPLKAFFGQGIPVNVFVLVCVILYNHKGAGIWCLVASLFLHMVAMVFTQNAAVVQRFCVAHFLCWLATFSVTLRILAATLLLLSLETDRHLVIILPLSPMLLLLGYIFVWQVINYNEGIRPGRYWRRCEAERKLGFDVSSQVVTFAFAGIIGTVSSYVKQGSSPAINQQRLSGRGRGYMLPDCFLSYSLVLGLLVQLFSTVTPYIWNRSIRQRVAKVYLRIGAYASLMFLVIASLMAAEEILQEWVFVACFIILIVPMFFFWLENRSGLLRCCVEKIPKYLRELQDDKAAPFILSCCLAPSFAALMASNSKYSIERGTAAASLSVWFKCSVLLELYGVLSCAVRMVVFSEMTSLDQFAKTAWYLSEIATFMTTVAVLCVVSRRYPDETANIF